MPGSPFSERVRTLYSRKSHHILPFVGAAYGGERPELLRMVLVGINTYVSLNDWEAAGTLVGAGWFSGWFVNGERRFYPRVKREAITLAEGLTRERCAFSGMGFDALDSFYVTNAIKVHVREAEGKRAHQITDGMFNEHMPTWRAELDLMAEHGVLPHVIVIFGRAFWHRACGSFLERDQNYASLRCSAVDVLGPSGPFLKRLRLRGPFGEQDALLVRVRHPSARTKRGSAKWLLAQKTLMSVTEG